MQQGSDIKYRIGADSSELVTELSKANAKLKEMQGSMDRGQKSTHNTTSAFSKLGTMIKMVAASAVAAAIVKFAQFAGKVDSVTRSFRGLSAGASMSSDAIVKSISIAAQGTMSNLQIMEKSNLALQLMGTQVADKLPELARIALATARATGQDVATAYGDLITAAARQSVMILDNVGISSAEASRYMDEYAVSIGKTRDNFNASEKSAAFFYAVMKAGNDLVRRTDLSTLTLGETMQILKSTSANISESFAKTMTPALKSVAIFMNHAATSSTLLGDGLKYVVRWAANAVIGLVKLISALDTYNAMRRSENETQEVAELYAEYEELMTHIRTRNSLPVGSPLSAIRQAATQDERVQLTLLYNSIQSRGMAMQETLRDLTSAATTLEQINKLTQEDNTGQNIRNQAGAQTPPAAAATGDTDANKLKLSEYYEYVGNMREAELIKEYESFRSILAMDGLTLQQREAIHQAHQQRILEIENKYSVLRTELIEGFSGAINDAMSTFETSTKEALRETLTGENSWDAWQKSLKKILQAFVVDVMWAVGKALLLQGIMATISPGAAAGKGGGGIVTGVLSKVLAKGNVPMFARGNIPAFPTGNVPSGHELAWLDIKREAVINAQSTHANRELLKWINDNPGVPAPTQTGSNITVQIDGHTIFEIMDNYRSDRARALGTKDYQVKSVYK